MLTGLTAFARVAAVMPRWGAEIDEGKGFGMASRGVHIATANRSESPPVTSAECLRGRWRARGKGLSVNVKVRAVIPVGNKVVVVRESRPPGRPMTLLPGGRVKEGENLEAALRREVREETSLAIEIRRLLYVAEVHAPYQANDLNLIFLTGVEGQLDTGQLELVPLDSRRGEEAVMPPVLSEVVADAKDDYAMTPRFLGNIWDSSLLLDQVEWS